MRKILISDYDDTFYINDIDIKENIKLIEEYRNKGNIFIIATGRTFSDFKKKSDLYNIKYDYVFLNHGSVMIDSNDEVINYLCINKNIINEIKNDLMLNLSRNYFCSGIIDSRVSFDYDKITKINVGYNSDLLAIKVNDEINKKYNNFVVSYLINKNTIEIISNKSGKLKAIRYLIDKLNINKDDVYTIGDNYSDIKMIENFNGSCMKNSIDELLKLNINKYSSVSDLIKKIIN